MMKAVVFGMSVVFAATPILAHGRYDRWTKPLPAVVEQNLPADVSAKDVLIHDGCFFYAYEGEVYELQNANGRPVCMG